MRKEWHSVFLLLLCLFLISVKSQETIDDDDDDDVKVENEPVPSPPHSTSKVSNPRQDDEDEKDEDDRDSYDPDEFEGIQEEKKEKTKKTSSREGKSEQQEQPHVTKTWKDFGPEIACVVLLVIYGINFYFGRKKNIRLATLWYRAAIPEFESNFALLGCYPEENQRPQLTKESQSSFQFYASGRVNCESVNVKIELCQRHDLFSFLYNILQPQKDMVIMDFTIPDDLIDSFVFAIVPRRKEKAIRAEYPDLDKMTKAVSVEGLPNSLVCLTDTPYLTTELLVPKVLDALRVYDDFIHLWHFSDRMSKSLATPKKGIQVCLYLNPPGRNTSSRQVDAIQTLTKFSFKYLDKLADLKLPVREKEKAKALRNQLVAEDWKQTAKTREEEAQKRKREKELKAKEARAMLSPQEKEKLEEKLARREAKKASNRLKLLKLRA